MPNPKLTPTPMPTPIPVSSTAALTTAAASDTDSDMDTDTELPTTADSIVSDMPVNKLRSIESNQKNTSKSGQHFF